MTIEIIPRLVSTNVMWSSGIRTCTKGSPRDLDLIRIYTVCRGICSDLQDHLNKHLKNQESLWIQEG